MRAKLIYAVGFAAALAASGPAWAQDKQDQQFMKQAIEGNRAEVQMGQLAKKNGGSEAVKSLGDMLVKDHSDNLPKAEKAAQGVNAPVPSEPNAKQKQMHARLMKLNGTAFDREFIKHAIEDHQKEIKAFTKASSSKNADVAAYAKETLPALQKHLQTAQAAKGSKGATTGSR
jgi:putative membrane protein